MTLHPEIETKYDRWLDRAIAILEGRGTDMGMPVLRMLAFRGHVGAMAELANRLCSPDNSEYDRKRGLALDLLLAKRCGQSWNLQNVSTTLRNHGDMVGYRVWLARAARLGDTEVIAEKRRFETRFPYEIMRRLRRYRPLRASERANR